MTNFTVGKVFFKIEITRETPSKEESLREYHARNKKMYAIASRAIFD
jgi:hypothetical protein